MTDETSAPGNPPPTAPPAAPPAPPAAARTEAATPHLPGWVAPAVLALIAFLLYVPALNYGLVYDDAFLITDNESVTPATGDIGVAFALFGKEYWEGVSPNRPDAMKTRGQALYRPLTLFIWALIANLNGLQTGWPFHFVSLLANSAVVVLLYLLARRFWGRPRLAFVAAFLFALHPLHVEGAAYVAGLSDVLAACTVLGGLLLYERATRDPDHLATGPWLGMMAVLFVGLLAKEQSVVLIAAVALTDWMFTKRGRRSTMGTRLAVYWGLGLTLATHVAVRYAAIGQLQPDRTTIPPLDNPLIQEAFFVRLVTAFKLLAMQVWLFLWPDKLSVDYSFNAIPVSRSLTEAAPLAGAVLVISLLIFGLMKLRRSPALGWGVLFFLGCSVFTANIFVPIGTIFGERLMYLPTVGACLAVAAVLDPILRDRRPSASPQAVGAVGLVILAVAGGSLGMRAWERTKDFKTTEKLFDSALAVVPNSARVHFQLGTLLATQKLFTKSEEHFHKTLEIYPGMVQAAVGLGDIYAAQRNWDKSIETYDRILRNFAATPGSDTAEFDAVATVVYHGRARAKAGKGDLDGAQADLQQAMRITQENPAPHLELARMLIDRERPEEAVPVLRTALQLAPSNVQAMFQLARAAQAMQDIEVYEEAIASLEGTEAGRPIATHLRAEILYEEASIENDMIKRQQALDMFEQVRTQRPELAAPYLYRARALLEQNRYADGILELDRALERSPRHPAALLFKAVALNASNRPAEALPVLQELVTVNPNSACWAAMAETHARLGDMDALQADYAELAELGISPAEMVEERAVQLESAGRIDDAILALEQGRQLPGYVDEPLLLRRLGILLVKAKRFDEALSTFDLQENAEAPLDETARDLFLPINRFRALLPLQRWQEAALQLDLFESRVEPDSFPWASLLHRRAQLLLAAGSPFADEARALDLAEEGITLTGGEAPMMFDMAIEALVALARDGEAVTRAEAARDAFPGDRRYQIVINALGQELTGNRESAVTTLRETGEEMLGHLADRIEARG
ncbi:MAG: tetratricopeptide repeat protein [Planctomycetota bacterium]|jgi:tetratricopeptide (TPR) repeat protein